MVMKKTEKDMSKIKNKKVNILMTAKPTPKKSILGKVKEINRHLFRDDRVEQKKREGWKVIDTTGGLTLMEKEI